MVRLQRNVITHGPPMLVDHGVALDNTKTANPYEEIVFLLLLPTSLSFLSFILLWTFNEY